MLKVLTCLLEILYAGPSSERSKVTGHEGVDRPKVTILSVILNSATLPCKRAYSSDPNSVE